MARSPFEFDITALKRKPGHQRPFSGPIDPPDDLLLETAEIKAETLDFDLQLEIAGEELVAQGAITVTWSGPCRRCLEPQTGTVVVDVQEIFQKAPVEGETWPLGDEWVDLEPMVRELVLLQLPVAPLCGDDCAGPDPERFPATVASDDDGGDGEAEGSAPPMDPRWAALGELRFDD